MVDVGSPSLPSNSLDNSQPKPRIVAPPLNQFTVAKVARLYYLVTPAKTQGDLPMPDQLDKIVEYMVSQSKDGVFYGSPRKKMESIGASSGPLYAKLEKMGIMRQGRGMSAKWTIPPHIITKYKKG
jgi:hypothetical protein